MAEQFHDFRMVWILKWLKKENDVAMHYNMCFLGGFLGAYAMFLRGGNFGSAQTGNLIEAVIVGLGGEWPELLLRLGALVIYVAGIIASFLMGKHFKERMPRVCLFVEALGLIIAGVIPESANEIGALYPIFFITSFQWGVFSGAKGYNSATIFSTNNVKQAVLGWTEYIRTKDLKQKDKAKFYTLTLTCFHAGVAAGFGAVNFWSALGAWAGLIPLLSAFGLTVIADQVLEDKKAPANKLAM